jgi:hypothetical protein
MKVKLEFKGALKAEFETPANDIQGALRFLQRNLPASFEADYLEITKKDKKDDRTVTV